MSQEQTQHLLMRMSGQMKSLSAVNDFGTYSCMVRNTAGEVGIGNVTITRQECKDINNRIKVSLEQLGFKL